MTVAFPEALEGGRGSLRRGMAQLRRQLRPEPGYRRLSLYLRVVLINAGVLAVGTVVLALTPATVSFPVAVREAIVLVLGLIVIVVANAFLLSVSFRPLTRLVHTMRTIDLLQPGSRLSLSGGAEVRQVIQGFNQMLERLEIERQESNRRAITTREGEQQRIGRELHDEVGQRLTGILLRLERAMRSADPALRVELGAVQDLVRSTLDEIGSLAWQLRPGILEDLGLAAALSTLVDGLNSGLAPSVEAHLDPMAPRLAPEPELVVFRVAQEGMTNSLRHGAATHIDLELGPSPDGIRLTVRDDGRGFPACHVEGPGLRGMRERALLVGAQLRIESRPDAGVTIQLDVPAGAHS